MTTRWEDERDQPRYSYVELVELLAGLREKIRNEAGRYETPGCDAHDRTYGQGMRNTVRFIDDILDEL